MRQPADTLAIPHISAHRIDEEDTDMPTIDREQLKTMLDNESPIRLIMAQGPGRYHAAHIPGSETFASLDEALDHLDVDDHM